jgi:Protein of unknown function (DUF2946)
VIKFFQNSRICHRLAAYIGLFAILVYAIAPVAAHAMMRQSGSTTIVLCTVHGMMQIEVASGIATINATDEFGRSVKIKPAQPCALCALAASAAPSPVALSTFSFEVNARANAMFVRLSGISFVYASVVQHHAPPTGPPSASFI